MNVSCIRITPQGLAEIYLRTLEGQYDDILMKSQNGEIIFEPKYD